MLLVVMCQFWLDLDGSLSDPEANPLIDLLSDPPDTSRSSLIIESGVTRLVKVIFFQGF